MSKTLIVKFDLKAYLYLSELSLKDIEKLISNSYLRVGDDEWALTPCGVTVENAVEPTPKPTPKLDYVCNWRGSIDGDTQAAARSELSALRKLVNTARIIIEQIKNESVDTPICEIKVDIPDGEYKRKWLWSACADWLSEATA